MVHLRSMIKGSSSVSRGEEVADRSHSKSGIGVVIWNVTYDCNMRCSHCYQSEWRPIRELSDFNELRIVDQLEELGKPLIFISGGEPLLKSQTPQLIRELKARDFRVILSTNGSLNGALRSVADSLDNIALPLYGPEEFHDTITSVKGSYNSVINALRDLRGMNLTIKTVASRSTVKHIRHLLDVASRYDVSTLYVCDLLPEGRASSSEILSKEEWRKLLDFFLQEVIMEEEYGEIEIDIGLHPSAAIYASMRAGFEVKRRIMREGRGLISISPTGDVLLSPYLGDLRIGDARRIKEALESDIYRKVGDARNLKGACGDCPFKEVCGGSRVKAYVYSGDLLGEDPTCLIN